MDLRTNEPSHTIWKRLLRPYFFQVLIVTLFFPLFAYFFIGGFYGWPPYHFVRALPTLETAQIPSGVLKLNFPDNFLPRKKGREVYELRPDANETVLASNRLLVIDGKAVCDVLAASKWTGPKGVSLFHSGVAAARVTWDANSVFTAFSPDWDPWSPPGTTPLPVVGAPSNLGLWIDFIPVEAQFDDGRKRWATKCRVSLIESSTSGKDPRLLTAQEAIKVELDLIEGLEKGNRREEVLIAKGKSHGSRDVDFFPTAPTGCVAIARAPDITGCSANPRCKRRVRRVFVSISPKKGVADGERTVEICAFPKDELNLAIPQDQWDELPNSPFTVSYAEVESRGPKELDGFVVPGIKWEVKSTKGQTLKVDMKWGTAQLEGDTEIEFVGKPYIYLWLGAGGLMSSLMLSAIPVLVLFQRSGIRIKHRKFIYAVLTFFGTCSALGVESIFKSYNGDLIGLVVKGALASVTSPAIGSLVQIIRWLVKPKSGEDEKPKDD
jgi:hypothetical protein